MAAINRLAGTPIASGDYVPVGIVAGDLGEISAATEYTEGATDATITGPAIMWEDTGDTLRPVSADKPLPVEIITGGSGGTEYTEDAAAAANPSGGMVVARRRDTLASETSADGDVVALNATDKGELYVKHADDLYVFNDGMDALSSTISNNTMSVTQAALDRTIDNAAVALQTDAIMSDTTVLTPKFVIIDAASSGDNTILAAVASKKIRVLSLFVVAAGAVTVRFESGAGGTALTGQMQLAANGGFVLPFNPIGWFETASNTLLNLELSGAVSVDGSLSYVEV